MTYKYRLFPVLLILTAAVIFTSCGAGTTERLTTAEEQLFEDYVLSSYFMQRGDDALPESRAAWDYTKEVILPTGSTPTSGTSMNYPEKGQKTVVTVEKTGTADVYKLTNLTTYPKREDSILKTEEVYYIKDNGDGYLNKIGATTPDVICTSDGTAAPLARETFTTTFTNGKTREEKINAVLGTGITTGYAEFPIDGPLTFPTPIADGTWAPAAGDADWSSMVIYEQVEGNSYSLWSSYKNIMGVRYYTEQGTVRTSVTYERMIVRDAETLSAMDNLTAFLSRLFSDNPDSNTLYPGETLTETVIRKKISGTKKTQINTSSTVYTAEGTKAITFTASYETTDDGTVISAGEPVAVYY